MSADTLPRPEIRVSLSLCGQPLFLHTLADALQRLPQCGERLLGMFGGTAPTFLIAAPQSLKPGRAAIVTPAQIVKPTFQIRAKIKTKSMDCISQMLQLFACLFEFTFVSGLTRLFVPTPHARSPHWSPPLPVEQVAKAGPFIFSYQ
ncbi:MAG: hypothetical protein WCF85_14320 [Rhodospirillaceae bacterium]